VVRLLELGLVAAVLYHAINGMKIIVIDFWPSTTRYYKAMSLVSTGIFVLAMIPITILMGRDILDLAFGWHL
jgi:succinate dehydrogenase / fumarate reductase cytochrome b subunit